MIKGFLAAGGVAALALGLWLALGQAAEKPQPAKPATEDNKEDDAFAGLLDALKKSPGCLGIETARTDSGKQVVFAWFEDKKAALKWYYSHEHKEVTDKFFPVSKALGRKPLQDIPDDSGPLMAIASVTLTGKPEKNKLPFSQIAIEIYQPLPGGLAIGGKFTPAKVKVPATKRADEAKK
jgi:antibiotic biosynthesis monooxygenase